MWWLCSWNIVTFSTFTAADHSLWCVCCRNWVQSWWTVRFSQMSHECKVSGHKVFCRIVLLRTCRMFEARLFFSHSCVIAAGSFQCLCAFGFKGNGTFCQGNKDVMTLQVDQNHLRSAHVSSDHWSVYFINSDLLMKMMLMVMMMVMMMVLCIQL